MSTHTIHTHNTLSVLARVLLASLFIPAGLSKVIEFASTVDYINTAGLPLPEVAAGLAAFIEIVAGLALVLGYHTRIAAFVLAAFTLLASIFFHAYWAAPAEQQFVTQLLFFKNVAVIGGLLSLANAPKSAWSLDHYLAHRPHADSEHVHEHQDAKPVAEPLPHA